MKKKKKTKSRELRLSPSQLQTDVCICARIQGLKKKITKQVTNAIRTGEMSLLSYFSMIHSYTITMENFHYRTDICFFVTMAVASTSTSTTTSVPLENLPVRCENCTISYGDFCYLYTANTEKLIKYYQDHGVIFVILWKTVVPVFMC